MLSAMSPNSNSSIASDSLDSESNAQELSGKIYCPERDYNQGDGNDDDDDEENDEDGEIVSVDNGIGIDTEVCKDETDKAHKLTVGRFDEPTAQRDYMRDVKAIEDDYQSSSSKSSGVNVAHNLSRLCNDDGSGVLLQQTRDTTTGLDQCSAQSVHQSRASGQQRPMTGNPGGSKDFEEVKQVDLFGSSIVALTINGRERLCLAQISNTLLKDFSYNEIHNRRVALGITCVQCTPIQLEMLRRAGAMPSSSRRCGMITRREAERLCRSFLVDEQPPELPENFYFTVAHRVNYGCKGRFVPARYISSRAKCIECFYCGEYYSPNKFIFHSHRQPHATDCNPPDSPNINSWRKHIDLDWTQEHGQDVRYAWEDVKSLFNGGTRRRAPGLMSTAATSPSASSNGGGPASLTDSRQSKSSLRTGGGEVKGTTATSRHSSSKLVETDDQLIDVESNDSKAETLHQSNQSSSRILLSGDRKGSVPISSSTGVRSVDWNHNHEVARSNRGVSSSMLHNLTAASRSPMVNSPTTMNPASQHQIKRAHPTPGNASKRMMANQKISRLLDGSHHQVKAYDVSMTQQQTSNCHPKTKSPNCSSNSSKSIPLVAGMSNPLANLTMEHQGTNGGLPFEALVASDARTQLSFGGAQNNLVSSSKHLGFNYPMAPTGATPNFIYNQLYSQLVQPQRVDQSLGSATLDAQLAIRHHLWSSLLANLQCNPGTNDGQHNVM